MMSNNAFKNLKKDKNKLLLLRSSLKNGALAHLARALRWQRRGDRFESDMLHYFLLNLLNTL